MRRMRFVPAVQPDANTTPEAWCFAFVEGQLLVPDVEGARFAPQAWSLFEALAPASHGPSSERHLCCAQAAREKGRGT